MIDAQRIGASIALLRKQHNMTQSQLANELQVTHQAVSKWERGVSLPDLELLASMSKLFRVRVDDLLGLTEVGEEEPKKTGVQAEEQHPPRRIDFADYMASADMGQVWEEARGIIKSQILKPSYDTWIRDIRAVYEDGTIVIVCSNPFQKEWLYHRYFSMIRKALEIVTEMKDIKLDFRVRHPNKWSTAGERGNWWETLSGDTGSITKK